MRGSLEVLWELLEVHKAPKATILDTFIRGGERGKRGEERGERREERREERGARVSLRERTGWDWVGFPEHGDWMGWDWMGFGFGWIWRAWIGLVGLGGVGWEDGVG